jgi:hypothetical protein
MLSLHFFFELPCKYTLGSDGLYLLAHSAFIEKAVEAGTAVVVQSPNSFLVHSNPL